MAQATQLAEMHIANPRGTQLRRQGISIKLRVVAGPRNTAHIDDTLNAVHTQQFEKVLPRARGVSNGENEKHFDYDS
jgi:hypothetical protein